MGACLHVASAIDASTGSLISKYREFTGKFRIRCIGWIDILYNYINYLTMYPKFSGHRKEFS